MNASAFSAFKLEITPIRPLETIPPWADGPQSRPHVITSVWTSGSRLSTGTTPTTPGIGLTLWQSISRSLSPTPCAKGVRLYARATKSTMPIKVVQGWVADDLEKRIRSKPRVKPRGRSLGTRVISRQAHGNAGMFEGREEHLNWSDGESSHVCQHLSFYIVWFGIRRNRQDKTPKYVLYICTWQLHLVFFRGVGPNRQGHWRRPDRRHHWKLVWLRPWFCWFTCF